MVNLLINGNTDNCIDVRDRGFQYGDGVFETIACKNNQLQLWDEHMQRLQQACQRLSLNAIKESVWLDDIKKLQPMCDSVIKLCVTRGVSGRGYVYDSAAPVTRVSACYAWPDYSKQYSGQNSEQNNRQGITATLCKTPISSNPLLAGIKHLNRLDNVLARNEWSDNKIAEGFMLDQHQHVIEGTMSNVFSVSGDELYTPSLTHSGVAGIMRQQVIKLAETMGVAVNIVDISWQNFLHMDEVFICNSLIEIWPVEKIMFDDDVIKFTRNELTMKLQQALHKSLLVLT